MVARRGGHDAATAGVSSRICSTVAGFHNGIPTTSNPPAMSVDIPRAGGPLKTCKLTTRLAVGEPAEDHVALF